MKFLLECLIAVFLHPVAYVLCLVHLAGRTDINTSQKVIWGIVTVLWGIGSDSLSRLRQGRVVVS